MTGDYRRSVAAAFARALNDADAGPWALDAYDAMIRQLGGPLDRGDGATILRALQQLIDSVVRGELRGR